VLKENSTQVLKPANFPHFQCREGLKRQHTFVAYSKRARGKNHGTHCEGLKSPGLVVPGQRQIVVLTEKGLLQASCECYQLARKRIAFHLPKTYQ
jgi:hypothetical protein